MRFVLTLLVLTATTGSALAQDKTSGAPNDAAAYTIRGIAWAEKGEYDKAIADFNKAIRLDPTYARPYYTRGVTWFHKKQFDKAITDLSEAIRLDPKFVAAYIYRGNIWGFKQDHDKVIADYSDAIRLDPKSVTAYFNRGIAWEHKKNYDKAIADYKEARRLDPKDGDPINNIAWLLAVASDAKVRNGKRAVELAKEALALDKNNAYYMVTLAAAYAETGNFVEAVRWQERALEDAAFRNDADPRRRLELYQKKQPYRQE